MYVTTPLDYSIILDSECSNSVKAPGSTSRSRTTQCPSWAPEPSVNRSSANQTVLPGATATDIWEKAGLPYQNLPASVVMSPDDMAERGENT